MCVLPSKTVIFKWKMTFFGYRGLQRADRGLPARNNLCRVFPGTHRLPPSVSVDQGPTNNQVVKVFSVCFSSARLYLAGFRGSVVAPKEGNEIFRLANKERRSLNKISLHLVSSSALRDLSSPYRTCSDISDVVQKRLLNPC